MIHLKRHVIQIAQTTAVIGTIGAIDKASAQFEHRFRLTISGWQFPGLALA